MMMTIGMPCGVRVQVSRQPALSVCLQPEPSHCLLQSSYSIAVLVLKQQSSVSAVTVLHALALNCQAAMCHAVRVPSHQHGV